jgi:hypothetical protein
MGANAAKRGDGGQHGRESISSSGQGTVRFGAHWTLRHFPKVPTSDISLAGSHQLAAGALTRSLRRLGRATLLGRSDRVSWRLSG